MMISVRMGVTRTSTPIAVLGECAHEEFVQLRVEDAIRHELALLGHGVLGCHCECKIRRGFCLDVSWGP